MKKRWLTLLLAVCMVMALLPSLASPISAVSGYNASAAAQYAINWYNSFNPKWYNWESEGLGDCSNYVSQCLYAGGLKMTKGWYWNSRTNWDYSGSWTIPQDQANYLVNSLGCQIIVNPASGQIALGDVMMYDWNNDGIWDHAAICVKVQNGTPWVCAHSNAFYTSSWKLGASRYAVIKMQGTQTVSYTVSFNSNGGTCNVSSKTVESGKVVGALPTANRTGYTFDGWYTATSGGSKITSDTVIKGNVTYYAHWTVRTCNVSFPDYNYTVSVKYGDTIPSFPEYNKEGYVFEKWYSIEIGDVTESTPITRNITVFARDLENYNQYYINGVYYMFNITTGELTCSDVNNLPKNLDIPRTIKGYPVKKISHFGGNSWTFYDIKTESITIPDTVTEIGDYAFTSFMHLKTITIPDSVTKIGSNFLWHASSLESIKLPKNLTAVGENSFCDLFKLKSLELPGTLSVVGDNSFCGLNALTALTIPSNIDIIPAGTFKNCSNLQILNIPNSVNGIGAGAFYCCDSLTTIRLPDNIEFIDSDAFSFCTALTDVTLPKNVKSIDPSAFSNCTNLEKFSINSSNNYYSVNEGVLYDKNQTELILFPSGWPNETFKIPQGTLVVSSAQIDSPNLKQLIIPNSLKKIEAANENGYSQTNPFGNNLESIVVAEGNPTYSSENGILYNATKTILVACPKAKTGTVEIANATERIGQYAFQYSRLKKIVFSPSLKTVLLNAFSRASSLETIVAFDNLQTLNYCFDHAATAGLKDVYFYGSEDTWNAIRIYGDDCKSVFSNATKHFCAPFEIVTEPFTSEISEGEKATFNVSANGEGLSYEWRYKAPDSETWERCPSSISGYNTAVLTPIATQQLNGYQFCCTVTDKNGTSKTTEPSFLVTKEAYPIPITKQPESLTVNSGETAEFTIVATGSNLTYQWQSKAPNETWKPVASSIQGNNKASLRVVSEIGHNGYQFRCVITDGYGNSATSSPAKLTVNLPQHTHNYTVTVTAPTCTEQGYTTHTCACGDSYVDSYVAAKGHSWDSGKVTKQPTETAEGVKTFTCTVCGETRTEVIPKLEPKPIDPPTPPTPGNPFTDVASGEYFYDPVLWAVNHTPQITKGTSDTTFSPNATCTRGQVVTFLWRAMGEPEPTSTVNKFTDVQSSDYFYKAVLWAVEKGITVGTSDTTFSPNDPCTRAHVVTFLWRAEGQPDASGTNPFADVASGQYYYSAVLWAVSKNITQGTSATTFSPDNPCTRAQIVTFLYRDMK